MKGGTESPGSAEQIRPPTLEEFEQFLQGIQSYPCKETLIMTSNREHMYFVWLADQLPLIDGMTLYDLYKRNVLDGGMKSVDFKEYCYINKFLPREHTDAFKILQIDFEKLYTRRLIEMKEAYEAWAQVHGIDTSPDAHMTLVDAAGTAYEVRTDFANRGRFILAS